MKQHTNTAQLEGDTILTLRKYRLTVQRPDNQVEECVFKGRTTTIGTYPDLDVVLDDRKVSRRHCVIEVDEHGYRLRDLGSKNGTYIGSLRVTDVYLEPRTTFRVGSHHFAFDVTDEEVSIRLFGRSQFGDMLGVSASMRELFAMLNRVAPTDATVLIEGESGTGKELVASAIHRHSKRNGGPFVVFDCSAVPKELIESELFGHIKGSFTGAISNRKGAFERANGGTLFLDELGELPLELQPKLLRALDSHEVRPIGASTPLKCDVRVVNATNRNLKREVEAGHFREDLYYRLAVIQVRLPPLRRRYEDIPILVEHFLRLLSGSNDTPLQVSFSTMEKLKRHRWPGNVRELKNFVERAVVLAEGNRVETRFLKLARTQQTKDEPVSGEGLLGNFAFDENMPFKDAKTRLVAAFERVYWSRLLERTNGNVSQAARIAGVHRKSVEYIMKKLDLKRSDLS